MEIKRIITMAPDFGGDECPRWNPSSHRSESPATIFLEFFAYFLRIVSSKNYYFWIENEFLRRKFNDKIRNDKMVEDWRCEINKDWRSRIKIVLFFSFGNYQKSLIYLLQHLITNAEDETSGFSLNFWAWEFGRLFSVHHRWSFEGKFVIYIPTYRFHPWGGRGIPLASSSASPVATSSSKIRHRLQSARGSRTTAGGPRLRRCRRPWSRPWRRWPCRKTPRTRKTSPRWSTGRGWTARAATCDGEVGADGAGPRRRTSPGRRRSRGGSWRRSRRRWWGGNRGPNRTGRGRRRRRAWSCGSRKTRKKGTW